MKSQISPQRSAGNTPPVSAGATSGARAGAGARGNGAAQDALAQARGSSPIPYRAEMEEKFGEDFSDVRCVLGAEITDADAATNGSTILFRDTNPDPKVVAHELSHILQHRKGSGQGTSRKGDGDERAADQAANDVMAGRKPQEQGPAGAAVHGNWLGDAWDATTNAVGDAFDMREDEERKDAEEDLQAFMGQDYSEENFHPSTGRGLFDAHYTPSSGLLAITVRVHFNFQDGDPTNADWVANASQNYPAEAFKWTDDEKQGWQRNAISTIQSHWSDQYSFHNTRPFWESLPTVNVQINISPTEAADDAHFDITVNKWPEQGPVDDAHITPPGDEDHSTGLFNESAGGGGITDPDQSHFERTPNTRTAYNDASTKNPGAIKFEKDSEQMVSGEAAKLNTYKEVLARPVMPPFPLDITGHTAADEADAESLSFRRALAVNNALSGGPKRQPTVRGAGAAGADNSEDWRRVNIDVKNFEADQHTVLHEFGHIFGLGDEYPAPDNGSHGASRQAGTEVAHSDLAEKLIPGQQPIVAHHDESIMGNGEELRPYHYVTFLEVLGTMTDTEGEWALGPGGGLRMQQPGAGDIPPIPGNMG